MRLAPQLFWPSIVLAVSITSGAAAAAPASIKQKEKTAKKLCSQGDFQQGVQILADLFVETGNVTYVYNQGRCYQQNGRAEQALNRFREYLRKAPDLQPANKAEVERFIGECEAELGRSAETKPAPIPAPVSPPETAPQGPLPAVEAPAAPPQDLSTAPPAPVREESGGQGLRIGGLVTAGVGVVALGLGLTFNILANKLDDDIAGGHYTRNKESSRDRYTTLGWVSYGVGAAGVVTGATLYLLGWRSSPSTGVAVLPSFGPSTATLSVAGVY